LLKASRLAESGGQAKLYIEEGRVKVNGQQESRIRAKLKPGDVVDFAGQKVVILAGEE
jgi:ribosome-associated protein